MGQESFHESYVRDHKVEGSSDRAFGLVFAVVFAFLCLWPLWTGSEVRLWSGVVAAVFASVALVKPSLLVPFNRIWLKIGLLLNRVVSPVVMAILFYVTVTPTGLVMRLFGKDPLRLRFDPQAQSYWIERKPPGPAPDTMINQF